MERIYNTGIVNRICREVKLELIVKNLRELGIITPLYNFINNAFA